MNISIKQLLTIVLFMPFIIYSQDECKKRKNYLDGSYTGCLNSEDKPHGKGVLFYLSNGSTQIKKEKWIYSRNYYSKDRYNGMWKNGYFVNGEANLKREISFISGKKVIASIKREGTFIVSKYRDHLWDLDGYNCTETYEYPNDFILKKEILDGFFKEGELFIGVHTQLYRDGRTEVKNIDIENENNQSQNTNYNDKYSKKNIDCTLKENIVNLKRKDRVLSIDLGFNGNYVEFTFDTGCTTLMIGKDAYKKIKRMGIKHHELDVKVDCSGVFSKGDCKRVIFDKITIGGCTINNVAATIALNSSSNLVGIDFFDMFGNVEWDMQKQQLILTRDR